MIPLQYLYPSIQRPSVTQTISSGLHVEFFVPSDDDVATIGWLVVYVCVRMRVCVSALVAGGCNVQ